MDSERKVAHKRVGDPVDANLATRRYRMDSQCKGICLIINNIEVSGHDPLKDGPVTGRMLTKTFQQLGFDTNYKENVSSSDMHKLMREFQKKDHKSYNCFVCCIRSHGGELGVAGTDGKEVNVNTLRKFFNATQCKSLAGKPKVFFVEACRGLKTAEFVPMDMRDGETVDSGKLPPPHRWEFDEDHILMSYATTPGHAALINTALGGHFFRCLTTNLLVHAASLPVNDILMLVGDRMGELGIEQTPIYESTLRKKLYFNNEQQQISKPESPKLPDHPRRTVEESPRLPDHPRRTVEQLRDRFETLTLTLPDPVVATTPQTAAKPKKEEARK